MDTLVDDNIYALKDTNGFYNILYNCGYKLKVVVYPTYHLGGDVWQVHETKSILTWVAKT